MAFYREAYSTAFLEIGHVVLWHSYSQFVFDQRACKLFIGALSFSFWRHGWEVAFAVIISWRRPIPWRRLLLDLSTSKEEMVGIGDSPANTNPTRSYATLLSRCP